MAFTVNNKAFCVLEFAKTESIVTVQRKFRIMYHTEPPVWYMIRNLRCTVTIDSVLANSKTQNAFLFTVNAIFRQSRIPPSGGTWKYAKAPCTKKTWRNSLPIDMLLYAVSFLVVAQSSSEIPEGLMNNPVLNEGQGYKELGSKTDTGFVLQILHALLPYRVTQSQWPWRNHELWLMKIPLFIAQRSHQLIKNPLYDSKTIQNCYGSTSFCRRLFVNWPVLKASTYQTVFTGFINCVNKRGVQILTKSILYWPKVTFVSSMYVYMPGKSSCVTNMILHVVINDFLLFC